MNNFDPRVHKTPNGSQRAEVPPSRKIASKNWRGKSVSSKNMYSSGNIFTLLWLKMKRPEFTNRSKDQEINTKSVKEPKINLKSNREFRITKEFKKIFSSIQKKFESHKLKMQELENKEKIENFVKLFSESPIPPVPVTLYDAKEFLASFYHELINIKENESNREFVNSLVAAYADATHSSTMDRALEMTEKITTTTPSQETIKKMLQTYLNLTTYYMSTCQFDELRDLELEIKRNLLFKHEGDTGNSFFTTEIREHVLNDIYNKLTRKPPSLTGIPIQVITLDDIMFIASRDKVIVDVFGREVDVKEILIAKLEELNKLVLKNADLLSMLKPKFTSRFSNMLITNDIKNFAEIYV